MRERFTERIITPPGRTSRPPDSLEGPGPVEQSRLNFIFRQNPRPLGRLENGGRMCAMKRWQFWVGVAISLVFLYFVVRNINFGDFVSVLRQANYWWVIPGVAVYFVGVLVRSWRWHYLLNPIKSIPTLTLWPYTAIGYMGNNIYPARAGEVLRAVLLRRNHDVAISASLATIVVERLFDGVTMLAFIFINLGG